MALDNHETPENTEGFQVFSKFRPGMSWKPRLFKAWTALAFTALGCLPSTLWSDPHRLSDQEGSMFHVVDANGVHVFTQVDPREDGFTGPVDADVTLEELTDNSSATTDNQTFPLPALGRSRSDPRRFRVFPEVADCQKAGFAAVGPRWENCARWSDHRV